MDLIDVVKLQQRVQALENRLISTLQLVDLHDIRLDAQLSRISELEAINRINKERID